MAPDNQITTNTPFDSGPDFTQSPAAATGVRDWLILEAIQQALDATQQFDGVYLSELPEQHGRSAQETRVAIVLPLDWQEVDDADGPTGVEDVVRMRYQLVLLVRNEDPVERDRDLDRLLGVCKNEIDGVELIPGQTFPGWTKLRSGKWEPAAAPERRMTVVGECAYLVVGDDQHDTEE